MEVSQMTTTWSAPAMVPGPSPRPGLVEQGDWLVEHRLEMDRGESTWLGALAAFDRDGGWMLDGQLSCVEWLIWRAKMARATAYEKLHVAHQLTRRRVLADAFAAGRLSYSALRAICRIEDPDGSVDEALVALAEAGSVADVERAVRFYQLHADQDRLPPDPSTLRGLKLRPGLDGTATVEVTLTDVEAAELMAILQAFVDNPAQSAAADSRQAGSDQSAAADSREAERVPETLRRADALMDMARVALAHVGDPQASGADRYMVHLVSRPGESVSLLGGTALDPADAGRVGCDASTVMHHVGAGGEPLALGRRTRVWSVAQRRAIAVRDRGRCRFPGCERRHVDIHHLLPWEDGGSTDITNGLLACPRHHTLLHRGFHAAGDANRTVTFRRPDGGVIGGT
ncbi:MAG: HNH endonuclease [Acidimicrobiales bacterium]